MRLTLLEPQGESGRFLERRLGDFARVEAAEAPEVRKLEVTEENVCSKMCNLFGRSI